MRHQTFVFAGLALAALAAGCGSVSEGGDTSKYEGMWQYTSGMVTGTCAGMMATDDLTGDIVTLAKGTASDLEASITPTCQVRFNMMSGKAVAAAGQSCDVTVPPNTVQVMFDSWTLETTDGANMTGAMAGKASLTIMGFAIPCTVTGTGSLTKL